VTGENGSPAELLEATMFGRPLRILAVSAAATVGALSLGIGVAQATPVHPINPCLISPNACQAPPPVKVDPCVIDPSLCPPPPTNPQPPSQSGNGSHGSGGTSNGSSSTGGSSSAPVGGSSALTGAPATVHQASHPSGGSSSDALVWGAGGTLLASLAGLGGLAVWRRRAVA
jgi:hypothetical protein